MGIHEHQLADAGGFQRPGNIRDHVVQGSGADTDCAWPRSVLVTARDRHGRQCEYGVGGSQLASDDARDGCVRDERQMAAVLLIRTDRKYRHAW